MRSPDWLPHGARNGTSGSMRRSGPPSSLPACWCALLRWAGDRALAIGLVITAELFNTALEAVVDLASPQDHPLAKRAKDRRAAGVLMRRVAGAAGRSRPCAVFWAGDVPRRLASGRHKAACDPVI